MEQLFLWPLPGREGLTPKRSVYHWPIPLPPPLCFLIPRLDARQEKDNGEGVEIHILDNLGLEAMEEVSVLVLQVGQHLPYHQLSGTALAAALTLALTPSEAWSPVLYGTPKTATTKDLLTTHGLAFEPKEWLVDFVVMDRRSATWRVPLVACGSEMHANHGTGYGFGI